MRFPGFFNALKSCHQNLDLVAEISSSYAYNVKVETLKSVLIFRGFEHGVGYRFSQRLHSTHSLG